MTSTRPNGDTIATDGTRIDRLFGGVRGQVTVLATLVTALTLTTLGIAAFLLLTRQVENDVEDSIDAVLADVEERIGRGEQFVYLSHPSGVEVVVGTEVAQRNSTEAVTEFKDITAPDGTIRQVTARATTSGLNRTLRLIQTALWVAVFLAALLTGSIANYAVARALRPVSGITSQAKRIASGNVGMGVPVPDSDDEIEELARTVNLMLGRLDAAAIAQRRFVSDASHELRTPLMVLTAETDLALCHPENTTVQALATATEAQIDRLRAMADDLLIIAAGTEAVASPEQVCVSDVVESELAAMPLGLTVLIDLESAQVVGTEQLIRRAVRNLLANAWRYAEEVVAVKLSNNEGTIRLIVDDDGPGVPSHMRETVFDRLARVDEDRNRDGGGAGLGLAIVAECARIHNGSAIVEESPRGGARFVLNLSPEGDSRTVRINSESSNAYV